MLLFYQCRNTCSTYFNLLPGKIRKKNGFTRVFIPAHFFYICPDERNFTLFSPERGRNFSRPIGFYLKLSKINIFDSMGCESAQWWQHRFAFVSMHTCGLQ
jgi:hypothetical protein